MSEQHSGHEVEPLRIEPAPPSVWPTVFALACVVGLVALPAMASEGLDLVFAAVLGLVVGLALVLMAAVLGVRVRQHWQARRPR